MFGAELYKIFTRKVVLIGLCISLIYVGLFFWMTILGQEGVIENGRVLLRMEAIRRDQEITAPYAGVMTMEKVEDIWATYGLTLDRYDPALEIDVIKGTAPEGIYVNYLNRFVVNEFFNETMDSDGKIVPIPKKQEEVVNFLDSRLYFGYAGQWSWFWDSYIMAFLPLMILLIIGIAPLFAEEHVLHTADVIRTSSNGFGRLFLVKCSAGLVFSSILYWVITGSLLLMHLAAYGAECLKVSVMFTNFPGFYKGASLGGSICLFVLAGWAACIVLTLITAAVSAASRQIFTSLVWSMALYALPYVLEISLLSSLRPTMLVMLLRKICWVMPMLMPFMVMEVPWQGRAMYVLAAALWGGIAVIFGYRKYCGRQK